MSDGIRTRVKDTHGVPFAGTEFQEEVVLYCPRSEEVLIPWALRATHMADLALDMVIIITEEQEDGEEKRLPNPTPTSLELCF